ncbi:ABC transporter permease [Streptomyces monticola]|uniref:ABC transporter permease n=1 Tax=Streptomyces monticola TaxID=2666263 RepID=A0ABW2JR82_9ACTN
MLKTAVRNILAHKARQLMTVLAVALGVAFVCGSLVFADSTAAAQRAAASKNFADIAVTVSEKPSASGGPTDPKKGVLDDALARKLAAVPGVASVRPSADGTAALNATDGSPLRVDTGKNHAASYVPDTHGKDSRYPLVVGRAPEHAGELAVDRATADAGHFRVGDTITLAIDGPVMTKRLVGIVTTKDTRATTGTLALFDKATAQKLFAAPGHYSAIDLSAAPGTDQYELARRVTDVLPGDRAEAVTGAARAEQNAVYVNGLARGHAKISMVFAGVALFIGSFLIVNTFTMLVARRSREIALLRAIGASRRQVSRSILVEALLVGLLASAAGFLLGLGVASVLPSLLTAGGHALPHGPLAIGPLPVVAALAVGVGVTVLAAWLPSRRAAKVAPVQAMRTAAQPPRNSSSKLRAVTGLGLLVLGAGLLVSLMGAESATDENLQTAMLGCGLLMAALIVLAPLLAVPAIRLTGRLMRRSGVTGRLARENALRDPRRTGATAATLLVSTALVAGLAVIGNSTAQALDRQAAAGLSADYVIGSRVTTGAGIDPASVQRVADTPGVRTASPVTDAAVFIGGGAREISGVDSATVDDVMKLDFVSGSAKDIGPGRIALSSTVAREHGVSTGDRIDAGIGRNRDLTPYTVVGVYKDNPIAHDVLGARSEVAKASFLPGSVQRILVKTDDGTPAQRIEDGLRSATGHSPLVKIQDRQALVDEAAGVMGDLLNVMYGLLAVGALISALGIMNTLAMSVAERTREIGALRALGMDRAGIRRMIRLEAVTVAAFGTLLGLAAGLFGAWTVGALANGALEQYSLALPWGTLLLVCLASVGICVLAGALPARRAAALGPLEAVAQA